VEKTVEQLVKEVEALEINSKEELDALIKLLNDSLPEDPIEQEKMLSELLD
jgi:hypothetical protein